MAVPGPSSSTLLLRARAVVPVSGRPIADGAVLISGNRIAATGRWRDLSSNHGCQEIDLGEVALLPGLVNAHCHLDYTSMAGLFPPPKVFTDWLKLITTTKAGWSYSDYAESWLNGTRMLARTGTTTVGDIEAVPELLPEVSGATPLRVFSFLEMIGITGRRAPHAVLSEAIGLITSLGELRCPIGLSPHAPYSTTPELLRLSGQAARRRGWRVVTHVAESALEHEMIAHGRGEMFEWLRWNSRDMSDCGLGSPVQHLERCGLLGENLVAVHANYLGEGDAELLGKRRAHVVHCPRSHHYFRHAPFPLRKLMKQGVNICLGTDSLATVYKTRRQTVELDMFEEMRGLASEDSTLPAKDILRMATVNGARALGMDGQIGEISQGALADVIAVPFGGRITAVHDAVLHHKGTVSASMIDGKWVVGPAAER